MKRRDLLKSALYAAAMTSGTGGLGLRLADAMAQEAVSPYGNTLVNVMLLGGADLRFLFVPEPGTEYAAKFWDARKELYWDNAANQAAFPTYQDVWNTLYLPVQDSNGGLFGIHRNAAWLKGEYELGNVAIISNVLGAENRRHDHAQLIMNTGDASASQFVYDRDGWGGRLTNQIGNANTVAVTRDISVFCNGIDPGNRNVNVIHAKDTRAFSLSQGNSNPVSANSVMARALKSYYLHKREEVKNLKSNWPYHKFLQHEKVLRDFGDALNTRLAQTGPVRPALEALYTNLSGNTLNDVYFGKQCANVYDSFLAADLFSMRLLSMEYSSWDTHRFEKATFESQIEDLFGLNKGLNVLTDELDLLGASGNTTYVFTTDFGRQLRANGDKGTDHGRGNYMIMAGAGVNGGTYGEMFPQSEIVLSNGSTRFDTRGADIEGRTAFELLLAQACDWVEPGSGAQVFPAILNAQLPMEDPASANLFV